MKVTYLLKIMYTNSDGKFDMIQEHHSSYQGAQNKIAYMVRKYGKNTKAEVTSFTYRGQVKVA